MSAGWTVLFLSTEEPKNNKKKLTYPRVRRDIQDQISSFNKLVKNTQAFLKNRQSHDRLTWNLQFCSISSLSLLQQLGRQDRLTEERARDWQMTKGPWDPSHEFIGLLHCRAPGSSAEIASNKNHAGTAIIIWKIHAFDTWSCLQFSVP